MSPASCPLCGRAVETVTRQSQAIRQAREILERWQSSDLFDRIQNPESSAAPQKQQATGTPPRLSLHRTDKPIGLPVSSTAEVASSGSRSDIPVGSERSPDAPPVSSSAVSAQSKIENTQPQIYSSGPPLTSVVREVPQLPPDFSTPPLMVSAVFKSNSRDTPNESTVGTVAIPAASAASTPEPVVTRNAVGIPIPLDSDFSAPPDGPPPQSTARTTNTRQPSASESGSTAPSDGTQDFISTFFETSGADLMEQAVHESATGPDARHKLYGTTTTASGADQASITPDPNTTVAPFVSIPLSLANAGPIAATASPEHSTTVTAAAKSRTRTPLTRPALHRKSLQPGSASAPVQPRTPGSGELANTATVVVSQNVTATGTTPAARGLQSGGPAPRDQRTAAATPQQFLQASVFPSERQTMNARASQQRFVDAPHATSGRGPHFEVTPPRRANLTSIIGQTLSYIGVLGLTIGTSMVIYGHFGGFAEYTPTGWLVTTVAQMLLFLGVINLVSGGMEQNNEDMSRRIQNLGEQLQRIEQATYMAQPHESAETQPFPEQYSDSPDYANHSHQVAGGIR